jgi:hypothetical protein
VATTNSSEIAISDVGGLEMSEKLAGMQGRIVVVAVSLLLVVAGLAGCSGQDSSADSNDEVPPAGIAADTQANADTESGTDADANANDNADTESGTDAGTQIPGANRLVVTFDYAKQSGHASNQFAVWLEGADGAYLSTLYATAFTADGGWKKRHSIPDWVEASGVRSMKNDEVDAISGATPKPGFLTYTYSGDVKDASGAVYGGEKFRVVVEGSLRWENRVVYSCLVDKATGVVSDEDTRFIVKDSDDGEALGADAEERGMLTNFHVEYNV